MREKQDVSDPKKGKRKLPQVDSWSLQSVRTHNMHQLSPESSRMRQTAKKSGYWARPGEFMLK